MFGLFGRAVDTGRAFRNIMYPGTTEIGLAKGWCIPARMVVTAALEPYHVEIVAMDEMIMGPEDRPTHIDAYVRVKDNQAKWAEYLLLRSNRISVTTPLLDPKNAKWAKQHNGKMPTTWDSLKGERWVETDCSSKGGAEYRKQEKAKQRQAADTAEEPVQRSRYAKDRTRPRRTRRTRRTRSGGGS